MEAREVPPKNILGLAFGGGGHFHHHRRQLRRSLLLRRLSQAHVRGSGLVAYRRLHRHVVGRPFLWDRRYLRWTSARSFCAALDHYNRGRLGGTGMCVLTRTKRRELYVIPCRHEAFG